MIILGTNSIKDTGFNVDNSVRLNDGSSDYFNRSPSSATNQKTFTISMWVKRGELGSSNGLLLQGVNSGNNDFAIYFTSADKLQTFSWSGGSKQFQVDTQRVFRDVSAFYHILFVADTTQGTDSNRIKIYINGVQETALENVTYPSQNVDLEYNDTSALWVGRSYGGNYFDGYMAEVVSVDGTALTPTDFGEFDEDSGIWKPKDVSGLTFGTNGFYLDFEDSSALGNDAAGSNNFTVNNLTAVDQSTDTCTNNFATMNALDNYPISTPGTFSEGNLQIVSGQGSSSSNGYSYFTGTFGLSTGKWYWEAKCTDTGAASLIGIVGKPSDTPSSSLNNNTYGYTYRHSDGKIYNNGSGASYGNSYGTSDIIGIALDLDNNKLYFSKNGTFQNSGDPTSGATGTGAKSITAAASTNTRFYFPVVGDTDYSDTSTWQLNFGGGSPISVSSGNTDGNGYGNFEYAVPSGYFSVNTKNLAEYG